MNNREKFEQSQATVIVIDRSTSQDMLREIERFGQGWRNGVQHWRTFGFELALLIGKRRGDAICGPRVVMTDDPEAAAGFANDEVAGLLCAWLYCCSEANAERVAAAVLEGCGQAGSA